MHSNVVILGLSNYSNSPADTWKSKLQVVHLAEYIPCALSSTQGNSDFHSSLNFDLYFTFLLPLWGEPARVALHGRLVAITCTTRTGALHSCVSGVYGARLVVILLASSVKPWQASWAGLTDRRAQLLRRQRTRARFTAEQSILCIFFFLMKPFPKWEKKMEKREAGNQVSKTGASRPKRESWQVWYGDFLFCWVTSRDL